jgi:flagellar motor switch protein FliG
MHPRNSNTNNSGIRKVAILVSGLDQAAADRLLEEMGPRQESLVRQAMVDLGDVDPAEQQRVMREFFSSGTETATQAVGGVESNRDAAHGVTIDLSGGADYPESAGIAGINANPGAHNPKTAGKTGGPPFGFLQETESHKLARVLEAERPQTIALVLSHLAPDQAAEVLARLPGAQQTDVVRRLIELEETDPEILREVERGLHARLSRQVRMQRSRAAGLPAVADILKASSPENAARLLDNLNRYDQTLVERFYALKMDFDDLTAFDNAALARIFAATEPIIWQLALIGAPPELIERFLDAFDPREADEVRRKLDSPGPVRLNDVEEARQRIVELAQHLATSGQIQAPDRLRSGAGTRHNSLEAVA